MRKIIVTGSAGLIGSESARHFAAEGYRVVGIDNDMRSRFFGPEASTQKTRDELVQSVLRREFSPFDRSIDTHVSNLRRKLGPAPDGTERIKGVRGIGYQYALHEPAPKPRR